MPGGRHVQWLYYGSGHLHQIRVDGHVLSDIERDALHQEIERTQGALESRYGWDPMGRLVAHKVGRRQALQGQPGMPSPQALRDRDQGLPALPQLPSGDRIARQYRYDPTGHLIATRDGLRGESHYRYDPLGRILAAQRGKAKTTAHRARDLRLRPGRQPAEPEPGRRAIQRRRGPAGRGAIQPAGGVPGPALHLRPARQHHRAPHRLAHGAALPLQPGAPDRGGARGAVSRTARRRASGACGHGAGHPLPLRRPGPAHRQAGRVPGARCFSTTGTCWRANCAAAGCRNTLYEPDSFVPLAKLESEWKGEAADKERDEDKESARPKDFAAYYYQCDQIGAPQELTDEQGRIVWAASYQVWGQTRALQVMRTGTDDAAVFTQAERPLALAAKGDVQALSFVEQPLRFQGAVLRWRDGTALQPVSVLRSGDGAVRASGSDWVVGWYQSFYLCSKCI